MSEDTYVRKDIYEAEREIIINDNENINRRIDDLKDNVNRQFTLLGILVGVIAFLFAGIQIGIALLPYILKH